MIGKPSNPGPPISACIVTWNEVDRLRDCIESLDFCQEVVVIDSLSTDGTQRLAAGLGARVIERPWAGYVRQKDFAVGAARYHWVVCIDADEQISTALRDEILGHRALGFPGTAGYSMPRLSLYHGKWIRHGAWYPNRQLRLFDRRRGRLGGMDPHDRVVVNGPVKRLRGDLLHRPYRSWREQRATIDNYTTIAARGLLENGCPFAGLRLAFNPAWRVIRSQVLRLGILDGWRGWLLAFMEARYAYLKYQKLIALRIAETPGTVSNSAEVPALSSESGIVNQYHGCEA